MAKGIYIGADNAARKVKKGYIGVDNTARKIKKGYIGINGKACLFYQSVILQNMFVAVGGKGKSYYSLDGQTWTAMSGLKNAYVYAVANGNNRFMATGVWNSQYCTNGVTWCPTNTLNNASYFGVAFGKDRFVTVGSGSYYSIDGLNWTAMTGLADTTYARVAYGNDRFVTGGNYGYPRYSVDGETWVAMTGISTHTDHSIHGIAYGNGRFVAVCNDGNSYYCTDGTTWSAMTGLDTYNYYCVAYGNGKFVSINEYGSSYYSTDGTTWQKGNKLESSVFQDITYGNDRFIAVGESGKSYYSLDGINWTAMSGLSGDTYQGVCYGSIEIPEIKIIGFSSCPFPTSWSEITAEKDYEGINSYGTWHAVASSSYSMSYSPAKALDNDESTYWRSYNLMSSSAKATFGIHCPENISIKPVKIHIVYGPNGDAVLQGFNVETKVWEDITTFSKSSSTTTIDLDITTEKYYSKFQFVSPYYSSSKDTVYVNEFNITEGFIKEY